MGRRPNLNISRRGKPFEEEVERGFKHFAEQHRIVWERFYDVADYVGRSCPKCHAPITRCNNPQCAYEFPRYGMMPPKRKGDFYALYKGTYHLIECKSSSRNGLPVGALKPHQCTALLDNTMSGGVSYIMICDRRLQRKPVLYIMRYQDWLNNVEGGVYLKWDLIAEVSSYIIPRTPFHGEPYFDLEVVF